MKASKYTILIVPDNSENNRSFLISRKFIRIIIGLTILFITGLIIMLAYFGPKVLEHNALELKYQQLASERMEVIDLMRELKQIKHMNTAVRKTLGSDIKFNPEPLTADSAETATDLLKKADILLSFSENLPSVLPVEGFVTRDVNVVSAFTHENHYGVDIAVREGDPILTAAAGFVIFSGWTYNMGNYIIVYHGNNYFTVYGHNQRNLVNQRDYVNRGDVIALGGNTGISSGPHLHFEIWKDGVAVDPKVFFPELHEKNVSTSNDG